MPRPRGAAVAVRSRAPHQSGLPTTTPGRHSHARSDGSRCPSSPHTPWHSATPTRSGRCRSPSVKAASSPQHVSSRLHSRWHAATPLRLLPRGQAIAAHAREPATSLQRRPPPVSQRPTGQRVQPNAPACPSPPTTGSPAPCRPAATPHPSTRARGRHEPRRDVPPVPAHRPFRNSWQPRLSTPATADTATYRAAHTPCAACRYSTAKGRTHDGRPSGHRRDCLPTAADCPWQAWPPPPTAMYRPLPVPACRPSAHRPFGPVAPADSLRGNGPRHCCGPCSPPAPLLSPPAIRPIGIPF